MNPIPISSCLGCNPDAWDKVDNSNGVYKCRKCKRETNLILGRKKDGKDKV